MQSCPLYLRSCSNYILPWPAHSLFTFCPFYMCLVLVAPSPLIVLVQFTSREGGSWRSLRRGILGSPHSAILGRVFEKEKFREEGPSHYSFFGSIFTRGASESSGNNLGYANSCTTKTQLLKNNWGDSGHLIKKELLVNFEGVHIVHRDVCTVCTYKSILYVCISI